MLCFGLILSCKKKDDSTPTITTTPTTTPTTTAGSCGSGSFSSNGVPISHNGLMYNNACLTSGVGMIGTDIGSIGANLAYYGPTVSYNNGLPDYILTVACGDLSIVTGVTYTAGSLLSLNFTYNDYSSGSLQAAYSNVNGEVTFTKLDLTNSLISGTFSFTNLSTIPLLRGSSGPTITKSILCFLQKSRISSLFIGSILKQ